MEENFCIDTCKAKCCRHLVHKKDLRFQIAPEDDFSGAFLNLEKDLQKKISQHNAVFDNHLLPKKVRFWVQMFPGVGENIQNRKNIILIRYDIFFECSQLQENKCAVYKNRPKVCRDFFCSKIRNGTFSYTSFDELNKYWSGEFGGGKYVSIENFSDEVLDEIKRNVV